ncbi:MAG: prepilin-type N-terminal cleavage/methylation domain-containing protein [Methylovulum sp.]|nr:MAG: prepilin-type N-terminal cleavage/methylation domain-containing protein [Methylovulum sp.]
MHKQPKYRSGFTLIELMVTIAIASIVLGIAIPSFTETIANNRLTTHANELVTALNLARSEAIKRGVQVIINRKGAIGQQWESGWDVFVDNDNSNTFNNVDIDGDGILCEGGEDCLLKTYDALPNGYTLRTGGNYTCWVAYRANGVSRGSGPACNGGLANDTFTLCSSSGATMPQRRIIISTTGRAMVNATPGNCP